jgi:hypothetical protein
MTSNKLIESQILQVDDPDYGPLEAVLGPDSRDDFEWRAEVEAADHTHIQAYKYDRTGHYLHLSADGRTGGPSCSLATTVTSVSIPPTQPHT